MRTSLKCGGKPRKKALLGADGAVMAAATMSAAGMNVAATLKSANAQAKAIQDSAKTQAQVIKEQTRNNIALQQESMDFTRQQNRENRDQQQEIQTTLQMLAGQENMNDRFEATKLVAKYGKKVNNSKQISPLFYGGGNRPFTVTDGGGAIPLQIDANGYGLYEFYGNDHDHYHKTPSGKLKSGVGIKLENNKVIEVQGNQNKDIGEIGYFTPNSTYLLSNENIPKSNKIKSIKNKVNNFNIPSFNPAKAVKNGMNPIHAFNIQQYLKTIYGLNDDGSRMKPDDRRKALAGMDILNTVNQTQYPQNGTVDVATGIAYATQNMPQQNVIDNLNQQKEIAKYGGRIKLKDGGRIKAKNGYWQKYAGATYSGIGNMLGAGMNVLGNYFAGNTLSNAYKKAGNILAEAYDQMKGVDLSELKREDYSPVPVMAVIRSANTNINPQLERIRRDAEKEKRNINANILSGATRQKLNASIDDRAYQRTSELSYYQNAENEKIKQGNAARIQESISENAKNETLAKQEYAKDRLSLLRENATIKNAKIAGRAQSLADGIVQSSMAQSNAMVNSTNAIGAGITGTAQAFANTYSANQKAERDYQNILIGADTEAKVNAVIMRKDIETAKKLYDSFVGSNNENYKEYARQLDATFRFREISNNNVNRGTTYVPSTRQKLATVFPNNPNYKSVPVTTPFATTPPLESVVWNPNYSWENDWYSLYNPRK